MNINVQSPAVNGAGSAPVASSDASSAKPAALVSVDSFLQSVSKLGVDGNRLKQLIGSEGVKQLQSNIDELSHTDQRTLKLMLDASRVPGSQSWRDVLGDIKTLDQRDQGRVLATLSSRIEHLPNGYEKSLMTDAIVDAMHELRGQPAVDAMWGFARGVGAAGRSDPFFEQFLATRK